MDVARFGDWATPAYTHAKVRENYSRRFRIRFPNEELPAARPLRTTPVVRAAERRMARSSVRRSASSTRYGSRRRGWSRAKTSPIAGSERARTRRRRVPRGAERRGARSRSRRSRATRSRDPAPSAWLDRVLASRLPHEGRIALAPMLNDRGKLIGDFTVANAGRDRFIVFGSGIAEQYHRRWFDAHLPDGRCGNPLARRRMDGLRDRRAALARASRARCGGRRFRRCISRFSRFAR